jgi:hypothetical protein
MRARRLKQIFIVSLFLAVVYLFLDVFSRNGSTEGSGNSSKLSTKRISDSFDAPHAPVKAGISASEDLKVPSTDVVLHQKDFRFIGPDGRVSEELINDIELTEMEAAILQRKFEAFRAAIGEEAKIKLRDESMPTDVASGVTKYTIEPFPAEGNRCFEAFKKSIASELPAGKCAVILARFPKGQLYGGLGERRMTLTFSEKQQAGGEVEIESTTVEIDPVTNEVICQTRGEFEAVAPFYPPVFSVYTR